MIIIVYEPGNVFTVPMYAYQVYIKQIIMVNFNIAVSFDTAILVFITCGSSINLDTDFFQLLKSDMNKTHANDYNAKVPRVVPLEHLWITLI